MGRLKDQRIHGARGAAIHLPRDQRRRPEGDPDWDWDVIDCIYFTMVTITTVGYGDMPALSQEMRVVTAFFGICGVSCKSPAR